MTAVAQDATFYEGEFKTLSFTVVDASAAAVSLVGATVTWRMCVDGPTGATVLTKTNSSGITIDAGTGGTGTITIAAADTVDLGGESYYHEMVVSKSSLPEVAFTGTIELLKSAIL